MTSTFKTASTYMFSADFMCDTSERLCSNDGGDILRKLPFFFFRKVTVEFGIDEENAGRIAERLLGHRRIESTMVYTHLINFEGDDFTCKTAKTIEEAKGLIEAGFEYVTDIQDIKLFRKRK